MKKIEKIVFMVSLIFFLVACNKDDAPKPADPDPIGNPDPDPEPEPENQAPGSFSLLAVENNATDVDVLPTFSWEAATDPDGDAVSYDLFLGTAADATSIIATDLGTTSFEISERLVLTTDYYWQVVAKDGQGKETSSATYHFTTRDLNIPQNPLTTEANFLSRRYSDMAVFDGKIWLIGGSTFEGLLNDVWFTTNGVNWTLATADAGFLPRVAHKLAVFDNRLWVIGGQGENGYLNDVWYTENGVTWLPATSNAGFEPRRHHAAAVFQDRMWVMGGITKNDDNQDTVKADVWSSSDGVIWEPENLGAPFLTRWDHTATTFNNALWVFGGYDGSIREDIWYSEEGTIWKEMSTNTKQPFDGTGMSTVVFDDKLWISGGNNQYEIWYSTDGSVWTKQEQIKSAIVSITDYKSIVYDNRLWFVNGRNKNVWVVD